MYFTTEEISRENLLLGFDYPETPKDIYPSVKPFYDLAKLLVETLPRNAERSAALRKLCEAKDCAVRAVILGRIQKSYGEVK